MINMIKKIKNNFDGVEIEECESLPDGYALTVTSWENDADNYKTATVYGLSDRDVIIMLKVLDLCSDSIGNSSKFGNISDYNFEKYYDSFINEVADIFNDCGIPEFINLNDYNLPEDNQVEYIVGCFMDEFWEKYGMSSCDPCCIWYTRVVSSILVSKIEDGKNSNQYRIISK